MRPTLLLLPLVIGCAGPESAEITYQSSLGATTRGLTLHPDGSAGHAGMLSTSCPFDTTTGAVTGDYDLEGSDEEVQDGGTSTAFGAESVLLVLPDTVHVLNKASADYQHEQWSAPGVVEARFTDGGFAILHDDCTVSWQGPDRYELAEVHQCTGAFDADPTTGSTVVGTDSTVAIVTPDEQVEVDLSADLLAWDPVTDAFYAARTGGTEVSAVETDGRIRWTASVAGPIRALSSAGADAAAVLVLELTDGGAVVWLDGETGAERTTVDTPSAASGVEVSEDGSTLALTLRDAVYFYGKR